MLQNKQQGYLGNLYWCFLSVANTWHLLLIGAADSAQPKFTFWGQLHVWFHSWAKQSLEEDGRKQCWEEHRISLLEDAKD